MSGAPGLLLDLKPKLVATGAVAQARVPDDAAVEETPDVVVDAGAVNPFGRASREPERFDFHGTKVANTPASVEAAMQALVVRGGIDGARSKLLGIRASVRQYAHRYEGQGDPQHDRRAAGGREVLAKLETAYAKTVRQERATVGAFVASGVAVAEVALAKSLSKLSNAQTRYGLSSETQILAKTGSVHTTHHMRDTEGARGLAAHAAHLAPLRDAVIAARRLVQQVDSNANYTGDRFEIWNPVTDTPAQARSKLADAEAAYTSAMTDAMRTHPVLALYQRVDDADALDVIAKGPSVAAARELNTAIGRVESNIRRVRRDLAEDPAAVLSMPRIVAVAKRRAGALSAVDQRMVDDAVVEESDAKTKTDLAVAVVSVALGIAAAIPTGGTGFLIAAGAAAAFDTFDLMREVDAYETKAAFAGSDVDSTQSLASVPSKVGMALAAAGGFASYAGLMKGSSELLEKHGVDELRRFGEALPGRQADQLLRRLGEPALAAKDVSPKQIHLATLDLGLDTVDTLARHIGGEGVVRLHRALGEAMRPSRVSVADGYVHLDDIVRIRVADLVRAAETNTSAVERLVLVSRGMAVNGGLAHASLPQLDTLVAASRKANIALPDGLTPIARQKLQVELQKAGKVKGAISDRKAQEILAQGQRLGAFDPNAAPLPADGVVIDSQFAISMQLNDELGFDKLQGGQKAVVDWLLNSGGVPQDKLRLADASFLEARGGARWPGIAMSVSRESPEYRAVVEVLSQKAVGRPKGGTDRAIVADLLFARVDGGGPATFAVQDRDVYVRLAKDFGVRVDQSIVMKGAQKFQAAYESGFLVDVNGRKLCVIPVAKELSGS